MNKEKRLLLRIVTVTLMLMVSMCLLASVDFKVALGVFVFGWMLNLENK